MAEEVAIHIDHFTVNVTNLRTAISSIDSSIKLDRAYEKTNIQPFVDDLETTLEAIKLLERYKQMLKSDTDILENVGQDMVENDERLAKAASS